MSLHLSVFLFTGGVCLYLWVWGCVCLPLGPGGFVHPSGQTPPRQTPAWADIPPENTACDVREMTIEAGATHPTGMHSCLTQ